MLNKKDRYLTGEYFCGNKISEYGLEHNRLDYATLAKAFDCVLNNSIVGQGWNIGCGWENYNGDDRYYELRYDLTDEETEGLCDDITPDEYDELTDEQQGMYEEKYDDIFQWYIINRGGAELLADWTNELVYYHETLDMYVWGVKHYGTSWDYVLTDIPCNCGYDHNGGDEQ